MMPGGWRVGEVGVDRGVKGRGHTSTSTTKKVRRNKPHNTPNQQARSPRRQSTMARHSSFPLNAPVVFLFLSEILSCPLHILHVSCTQPSPDRFFHVPQTFS